jgi:hypothetical protein
MRHLVAVAFVAACGAHTSNDEDVGPDAAVEIDAQTAVGECTFDSDCEAGKKCVANACVIGGCGQATLQLEHVAPNLLLVLDRSCSMRDKPTGSVKSKWQIAVDGIDSMITKNGTDIRWGMTLFPDISGQSCTQETFAYPVADNMGQSIKSTLAAATSLTDALYPDGPCVTNIDTALDQAAGETALNDATRKSYVMLVTDGAQSGCNANGGDSGSVDEVAGLLQRGVKTFVVGFGSAVDGPQLDLLADAGGTARTSATKYYRAETAGELDQALASIGDQVLGCDFVVTPTPPVLDQTYVWFEKTTKVPRDMSHAQGWDYDTTTSTLTFYGNYCTQLKTRAVDTVDVVYDCNGPLL